MQATYSRLRCRVHCRSRCSFYRYRRERRAATVSGARSARVTCNMLVLPTFILTSQSTTAEVDVRTMNGFRFLWFGCRMWWLTSYFFRVFTDFNRKVRKTCLFQTIFSGRALEKRNVVNLCYIKKNIFFNNTRVTFVRCL